MPQQLIYTSAPRGITSGRSGYCTVARSGEMRETLAAQLEQFSYYHHQALGSDIERLVHAFRVLDVRGTRYFVLSRIQDVGLDFTQRTNFLAHHLVFTMEEIAALSSPPLLFLYWDGWKSSWDGEPELLSKEEWGNLHTIKDFERDPGRHYETAPARSWRQLTGAAVNAFGLLDLRGSAWLAVNEESDEALLRLLAESLRMMELRNRDTDYHAKAWQISFTINFQEQDNPSDFRWKCFRREVSELVLKIAESQVTKLQQCCSTTQSAEEIAFAEKGPRFAEFTKIPQDSCSIGSSEITLHVKAVGIPYPDVEWQWAGKRLKAEIGFTESGETWSTCAIRNLQPGTDQYCKVIIRNTYNQVDVSCRVQVKAPPSIVRSEAGKPHPADKKYPSTTSHESTSLLIRQILDESKIRSSTNKLWECIRTLDKSQEHKSFDDVRPDYLITLKEFCDTQKEESTERIAARCHDELQARTRRTFRARCKWIGKLALRTALTILIFGGLWWLFQIIREKIASKGDPAQTAPTPKRGPKSQ